MNLRRLTARAATVGAVAALAAGGLVGATATSANAGEAANVYSCTLPLVGASDVTLTVNGSMPVPQYWAGAPVPPKMVNVTAKVDDATKAILKGAGLTSASSPDFALSLGSSTVKLPLSGAVSAVDGNWAGAGSNLAFTTPNPGTVSAVMPKSFHIAFSLGGTPVSAPCALKAGQSAKTVASIVLMRQVTSTTAKAVNGKKGKTVKLPVTVTSTSMGTAAPGKVVVKEGKKTLGHGTLKAGKVSINLGKKLKAGKHKLTVLYAGTPSFGASKTTAKVTVKK